MAHAGILFSLRASTVKQAQQTLGLVMMIIFFSPTIVVMTLSKSTFDNLEMYLAVFNQQILFVAVIAVLAIVDGALLLWAMARFKRNRMMT